MHHKKSEIQIGTESTGISSDFTPTPPYSSIHQKYHNNSHHFNPFLPHFVTNQQILIHLPQPHHQNSPQNHPKSIPPNDPNYDPVSLSPTPKSTPHKRLNMSQNSSPFSKKDTILSQNASPFSNLKSYYHGNKAAAVFQLVHRRLRQLRRLRVHLRLVLLLSLPFFYFLVSNPSHSFVLDLLSALAFSGALLFSLNLALPRLPSIRLFLARSFPIKLPSSIHLSKSKSLLPVFWSIGSRGKLDKRESSGCWVEAYNNGDVYEGEFHKGKCSGSGVYYYNMSGRYEGDWVDGKYDGYGVETWARGSRYRGQYRQGLRNGFGVYRFYTGDVYAGEWANGQSHGCGVHTCEDGSRYVGEFKWGVKHGLGHYHFR